MEILWKKPVSLWKTSDPLFNWLAPRRITLAPKCPRRKLRPRRSIMLNHFDASKGLTRMGKIIRGVSTTCSGLELQARVKIRALGAGVWVIASHRKASLERVFVSKSWVSLSGSRWFP